MSHLISKRFLFGPAALAAAGLSGLYDLMPVSPALDPMPVQASSSGRTRLAEELQDVLLKGALDSDRKDQISSLRPLSRCDAGLDLMTEITDGAAVTSPECVSDVFVQHFLSLLLPGPDEHPPAQGDFTSGFGLRWGRHHRGIDIANAVGTPIHAVWAGEVVDAQWSGGYGLTVEIRHRDGSLTRYAHCSRLLVGVGERVAAGQIIAEMGNTGNSTGPHLHFEVIDESGVAIDPVRKIKSIALLARS